MPDGRQPTMRQRLLDRARERERQARELMARADVECERLRQELAATRETVGGRDRESGGLATAGVVGHGERCDREARRQAELLTEELRAAEEGLERCRAELAAAAQEVGGLERLVAAARQEAARAQERGEQRTADERSAWLAARSE